MNPEDAVIGAIDELDAIDELVDWQLAKGEASGEYRGCNLPDDPFDVSAWLPIVPDFNFDGLTDAFNDIIEIITSWMLGGLGVYVDNLCELLAIDPDDLTPFLDPTLVAATIAEIEAAS